MKQLLSYSLATATLVLALTTQAALAQGPGSGGPTPGAPADPTEPTAVPIDGGASLLLASGAAYGLRKLRRRRA
ncbi:PID-CTERM protein-sorting domain-containing protein [Hymenobacter cavernae]|nr:hypothetical protein [Hymenobacter cavernae]